TMLSNNFTLHLMSPLNFLSPKLHIHPIAILAFLTLSLICPSSLLLLFIIYPRYLISFTSSIFFPPHHQLPTFFLPPSFWNTTTFDFSVLNSSFFLSKYPFSILNITLICPSSSATITISSAYSSVHTLLFPTFTPPGPFSISSSISAIYILNNVGLSGHPCLTPFFTLNSSVSSSPILTLHLVSS
ncbi:hypothetical protein ALC56_00280, partial [Trachymyrmex septentrionalis]